MSEGLRHLSQELSIMQVEGRFGQISKRCAQQLKSRCSVVTPDQQHALETSADNIPSMHSMLDRKIKQHPDEAVCRGQITGEECDRTRRLKQSEEDRKRMIGCPRVLDRVCGDCHRLIGK